jgi:hypothetical protein
MPRFYLDYATTASSLGSGSGKLLLALASTVILGSGSRETRDHIFSHDSGIRLITRPTINCYTVAILKAPLNNPQKNTQ